jgi:hypothetical protein
MRTPASRSGRFRIDLKEEGVSSARPWAGLYGSLVEILSSRYLLVGLGIILLLGAGYLVVIEPLLGAGAGQREHLRTLRLQQASLAQEKEAVMQEAVAMLGLEAQSPGWARLVLALAEKVPEGVWLSRVSLEEDRAAKARKSPGGPKAEAKNPRLVVVLEGRVDARRFPSVLEPLSVMMRQLKADPGFGPVVPDLELVNTQVTKEDPMAVGFEMRGHWSPEAWKGKPEERIRQMLSGASSVTTAPPKGSAP